MHPPPTPPFLWLPVKYVPIEDETIRKRNKFTAKRTAVWLLAVDLQLINDVNNWGFYVNHFLLTSSEMFTSARSQAITEATLNQAVK